MYKVPVSKYKNAIVHERYTLFNRYGDPVDFMVIEHKRRIKTIQVTTFDLERHVQGDTIK